jgi:hypothetical protein
MILASEQAKIVHALDPSATVTVCVIVANKSNLQSKTLSESRRGDTIYRVFHDFRA